MTLDNITCDANAPETAALLKWVTTEKANGLVDIKFLKKNTEDSTVESFCAEVNQMLRSRVVHDTELF